MNNIEETAYTASFVLKVNVISVEMTRTLNGGINESTDVSALLPTSGCSAAT